MVWINYFDQISLFNKFLKNEIRPTLFQTQNKRPQKRAHGLENQDAN